mgnify:CR=1 FL=1
MENKMEKRYGLPTAISMVIGIVIGSGVFIKGGKVLSLTGGNLLQGIAVVGIVGLICIICSLVFATLGSKYEKVNGVVDYAELALGSKYAYYVGWFMTTIYTPALASMLAFFSAMMFLQLFGISSIDFANGQVNAVAIGVGAGFLMIGYGINALSPKIAGKLQVGMTVIKLIPLILMGVAGTIAGLVNGTTLEVLDYVNSADYVAVDGTGFFKAIVGFAFAYEGWILATSINAELKDSKKNLPRALVIGALVTIVLYALYIWAMSIVGDVNTIISTWPFGESLPRLAFSKLFGNVIGTIVYVFITISCLGTMNGLMLGCCRGPYSLAARGEGPHPELFSQVDKVSNLPNNSAILGLFYCAAWGLYFYLSNLAGTWSHAVAFVGTPFESVIFFFDPTELPIITIYALYIPIFINWMKKATDESALRRYVIPTLAICGSIFMVIACLIGHKMGNFWYLLTFAVIMLIGKRFAKNNA